MRQAVLIPTTPLSAMFRNPALRTKELEYAWQLISPGFRAG
jgi:hypothetical protein